MSMELAAVLIVLAVGLILERSRRADVRSRSSTDVDADREVDRRRRQRIPAETSATPMTAAPIGADVPGAPATATVASSTSDGPLVSNSWTATRRQVPSVSVTSARNVPTAISAGSRETRPAALSNSGRPLP